MIFFYSGHLENERERPETERKYMNSDKARCKEPGLPTLISEVGVGTNIQSSQAHALQQIVIEDSG